MKKQMNYNVTRHHSIIEMWSMNVPSILYAQRVLAFNYNFVITLNPEINGGMNGATSQSFLNARLAQLV